MFDLALYGGEASGITSDRCDLGPTPASAVQVRAPIPPEPPATSATRPSNLNRPSSSMLSTTPFP